MSFCRPMFYRKLLNTVKSVHKSEDDLIKERLGNKMFFINLYILNNSNFLNLVYFVLFRAQFSMNFS